MGQQEVFDFLSQNKNKWFSVNELQEKLKTTNARSIREAINRMYKFDEIKIKEFKIFNPKARGMHRHRIVKVKYNG